MPMWLHMASRYLNPQRQRCFIFISLKYQPGGDNIYTVRASSCPRPNGNIKDASCLCSHQSIKPPWTLLYICWVFFLHSRALLPLLYNYDPRDKSTFTGYGHHLITTKIRCLLLISLSCLRTMTYPHFLMTNPKHIILEIVIILRCYSSLVV